MPGNNPLSRFFSEDWTARIMRVVEIVERNIDTRARSRRSRGSGGDGCESQNTIWHVTIFGAPTSGTFDLRVTVNSVLEILTFNFDDTAAAFKTTLATHSEISTEDNLNVTAGPLPNATMSVEFIEDLGLTLVDLPTAVFGSLSGGTGRGIICTMAQRGHS